MCRPQVPTFLRIESAEIRSTVRDAAGWRRSICQRLANGKAAQLRTSAINDRRATWLNYDSYTRT